jgi:hypothetical protein
LPITLTTSWNVGLNIRLTDLPDRLGYEAQVVAFAWVRGHSAESLLMRHTILRHVRRRRSVCIGPILFTTGQKVRAGMVHQLKHE